MAKRKSNKQVKAMIVDLICDKFKCNRNDFWWQDSVLFEYNQPIGHFEGDESRFFWHCFDDPYVSIKA